MIICRVCLDNSEQLIPLQSDNIEALPIVHMLKEFTIINLEHQLPKYICEPCSGQLDIAYAFKRKYEDSIVKFVRQMSDPIEKEEFTTSESSSTMTEDVPDIKPHETMNFNYPEMNCFTVTEEITVEDSKVKVSPQLLSLMDDLRPSDVGRLTSDESTDETQYEAADHSSTDGSKRRAISKLIECDISKERTELNATNAC
ncbi:uncharacterized protein LOC119067965 isoform X2 [Bradysia coprophila]|uniref:uncharacterized protein LOC119067965 isoform X2 n=1 Tax=Bradysia coprophila TaxID=38358 RepID=UPI00187D7A18|nr:uncharacterized protein LOC119067965 isoform X2 [Bradysia coprophila]